jgi:hypothetical protein
VVQQQAIQKVEEVNIKIMSRDYPLAPTPEAYASFSSNVSVKETPNRKVYKRTSVDESGNKRVAKEVDSKRGYKSVEKINGKRVSVGKSY